MCIGHIKYMCMSKIIDNGFFFSLMILNRATLHITPYEEYKLLINLLILSWLPLGTHYFYITEQ